MTGTVVAVIVVILIVVALVAAGITRARRRRLQQRFGPEYDRVVEETDSRRKAEAELTQRERRVKRLEIRPLDPATRARHADEWRDIQERFVDTPQQAVADAQLVVGTVMTERGYPIDDEEQVLADLSVEHGQTLDEYRSASAISAKAASGAASTEDLRQAMIHYRALFQDLLGEPTADEDVAPADEVPAGDAVAPASDQVAPASDQVAPASDREVPANDQEVPASDQEAWDPAAGGTVLDEREDLDEHVDTQHPTRRT